MPLSPPLPLDSTAYLLLVQFRAICGISLYSLGAWRRHEQKPARPRVSEQLDLDVESLAFGGKGVARRDGYVVFVAGGAARATASAPR